MRLLTLVTFLFALHVSDRVAAGPPTGPERFLAVPSWQGNVTWFVDYDGELPGAPVPGMRFRLADKSKMSGTLARCPHSDSAETGCPGGRAEGESTRSEELSVATGPLRWSRGSSPVSNDKQAETYGSLGLVFNFDTNTYMVSISGGVDVEHYRLESQNDDNPSGTWRQRDDVAQELHEIALPASGLGLSGSQQIEIQPGISGQLTWSFSPAVVDQPQAFLLPPKDYETWLPEAGADEAADGNTFALGFALEPPKTSNKPITRGAKWRFELVDVSSEPGTCLNHPIKAKAKTTPDMAFEAGPGIEISKDGKSAWTKSPVAGGALKLRSRDWAAYGRVHATAELDGHRIEAEVKGQPGLLDLTVPKDADHDKVADAFEGALLGLDERSDAEDPPHSKVAGDTWTHYEEYRGLMAMKGGAESHVRLNPAAKDLVYADEARLLDEALWFKITNLKPIRVAGARLITLPSDPDDRGTSWNSSYARHEDRGIPWLDKIAGDGMAPRITMMQDLVRREVPRDPAKYDDASDDTWVMILGSTSRMRARVWPVRVEFYVRGYLPFVLEKAQTEPTRQSAKVFKAAGYTAAQIDGAKKGLADESVIARITKQLMQLTTIHELAHAVGIPHHESGLSEGEQSCVLRYFDAKDKFGIMFGEAIKATGTTLPLGFGTLCTSGDHCTDHVDLLRPP
ncbi:MAG: hypothetical protein IV100_12185 [Myxococcales bacterium]|nr:hypothetical protein [Myxococcales bacterium]